MARPHATAEDRLALLKTAVLTSPGARSSAERSALCDAARRLALDPHAELGLGDADAALVRAVVERPGKADIAGALARGRSEDDVFDVVIAAALGAALARAEAGLKALGQRA